MSQGWGTGGGGAAVGPPPLPDAGTAEAWKAFGDLLRQWRRKTGLTQAQVGAAVGYDHTAISKLEHGTRRATPQLARRLDGLLMAGGGLSAACAAAEAHAVRASPLPGEPEGGDPFSVLPPGAVLPVCLPAYGLSCPVHDEGSGCTVPVFADVIALHTAFCALGPATAPRPPLDADTVHALTGLLAVCLRADEELAWPGAPALIERTLHAMARWMSVPAVPYHRHLAPLAAEYAQSAGCLRLLWGRNATAMAWLDRALGWASATGHIGTEVAALSDMSTLARLEGDGPSALAYGGAIRQAAGDRHWAGALSDLYQARGHAVRGDTRQTLVHIGRAWSQMDRVGERDEKEAPWLSVASVRLRVESGAAGALRDIAAVTGDRRLALRAAASTRSAMSLLSPGMRSARMLFTVRMADAYACARDPQTALDIAGPVLDSGPVAGSSLLGQELRGLRGRLVERWAGRPEIDEFARRAAAVVVR